MVRRITEDCRCRVHLGRKAAALYNIYRRDRQPAASQGPARPRGNGYDQGSVYAAMGRPSHRQQVHGCGHGRN